MDAKMKFMLKARSAGMLVSSLAWATAAAETNGPAIIPLPQTVQIREGVFQLELEAETAAGRERGPTRIVVDAASRETGQYLAAKLGGCTGHAFQVDSQTDSRPLNGTIILTTNDAKAGLGAEGYELTVTPESVTIRALESAGMFYGAQTLLQLIPPRAIGAAGGIAAGWRIPCVQIEDQPRFKWRGLMLDVSRHFFSKEEIKQLLEAMALYKLNTFHWHLADDQGWRLQIKKYPLLTEVGAWRKGIGFGLEPKGSTAYGQDGRYGGYYTPEDIRDVLAFAQERHITIVPEIEMPGHASAALMAYPQFSCTGGPFTADLPGGIFNGVYCAGKNETFAFLQDILAEVFDLFPGKYVHIGGDEAPTNNWRSCRLCQSRMKAEGLKTESELESYFIRRMEKFINARQRNLIGWSEIREGGLAENAAIMDWMGGALEATSAGHDVVMSPLADCYFDHYQSQDVSTEPRAIGGYLPLEQVYAFEPIPAGLAPRYQWHILGAQANVWTEYMPSLKQVEYMVFPRLCALAEVVWSPRAARNWESFKARLQTHYLRLDAVGVNYRHSSPIVHEANRAR